MQMRSIANVLGFGLALTLISGCSTPPQRIEVSATPVDRPQLVLPSGDALNMKPVEWIIITPENYEQVFEDLRKTGRPVVLFALTDKGYENIGLNFSSIRAYIQQQKAIIAAYEGYYKNAEEALANANSQIDGVKQQVDSANTTQQENTGIFGIFK